MFTVDLIILSPQRWVFVLFPDTGRRWTGHLDLGTSGSTEVRLRLDQVGSDLNPGTRAKPPASSWLKTRSLQLALGCKPDRIR
ncbi:hypothetical protein GN956_G18584 [Arapaima gigas]